MFLTAYYSYIIITSHFILDKGINHYTSSDELSQLRQKMMTCLDKPFVNGVSPRGKQIPLYFGATGGMRLLR